MQLRCNIILLILCSATATHAQSTMDSLLSSIAQQNKTILAQDRLAQADRALYQTGLALPNPEVSFDWMQGFPSSAGDQTDIVISQAFDFPSAYKHRRQIADLKSSQSAFTSARIRREVLLQAKLLALDLIHLNKSKAELTQRLTDTEAFYENYVTKLEQQDATILDVRKAQLRLINIRTELQLVETRIQKSLQKLTELNGGDAVTFADTTYPAIDLQGDDALLVRAAEEYDPVLQSLMTSQRISGFETQLTKSLILPGFDAGYHYQGILGQNFHGMHLGVSVPLWENKRRVTASKLQEEVYTAQIEEQRTQLANRIAGLYDQYQALLQNVNAYQSALALLSDQALLDTALQAGQITVLDYFIERSIYYESVDRYLELEASMQQVAAELLQYRL